MVEGACSITKAANAKSKQKVAMSEVTKSQQLLRMLLGSTGHSQFFQMIHEHLQTHIISENGCSRILPRNTHWVNLRSEVIGNVYSEMLT